MANQFVLLEDSLIWMVQTKNRDYVRLDTDPDYGTVAAGKPVALNVRSVNVNKPPFEEAVFALAQAALGVIAMLWWKDKVDESLDVLYGYIDKQTTYAEWYHDHYTGEVYSRELETIGYVTGLTAIGPSYGTHGKWGGYGTRHENALMRGEDAMLDAFAIDGFGSCDHELESHGEMVGADAAFIEARVSERRQERMRGVIANAVAAVAPLTDQDPNNIFKYIQSAIELRSGSLDQAIQGFNGAIGSLGYSMGRLTAAVRSGDTGNADGWQRTGSDTPGMTHGGGDH